MAKRRLTMKRIPKSKSDNGCGFCLGIIAFAIVAFTACCYFFGFQNTMSEIATSGMLMFIINAMSQD